MIAHEAVGFADDDRCFDIRIAEERQRAAASLKRVHAERRLRDVPAGAVRLLDGYGYICGYLEGATVYKYETPPGFPSPLIVEGLQQIGTAA